jgi:hypothetical protein
MGRTQMPAFIDHPEPTFAAWKLLPSLIFIEAAIIDIAARPKVQSRYGQEGR